MLECFWDKKLWKGEENRNVKREKFNFEVGLLRVRLFYGEVLELDWFFRIFFYGLKG